MFRFFVDRPIFSTVISVVIMLAGLAAALSLPVEQYPNVVPPQIVVTATYPGASAEVLGDAVAAPLEEEINGVDNMLYMESTSTDAGTLQVVVSFAMETDPDQAAINVNNRVQAALPRLPQQVRDIGVRVKAQSTNMLLVAVLYSPDGSRDPLYISNYGLLNVLDELVRLPGVGDASLFGANDYSMRIWLRPDVMAQYQLTPSDVANALREQNVQFAAGRLGAEPMPDTQLFTYTVTAPGQLSSTRAFGDIILRAGEGGNLLRLRDVARIELGSQNYNVSGTHNGNPAVPIQVYLQPGANAIDTAEQVRETLAALSAHFPDGVAYQVPYDTTEFVNISVREVYISLLIAVILVVLVTYLFLQRLLATLIPVAAIPVSLIGTFAGMQLFGFSINLLTLFGLVLAIGIVVDNAIIVLENVERLMEEEGLNAREATVATMGQVAGAVVASTLVLVAVFVPVTFLGGLSGELYRQFAVTIAVSVVVSGVVAVTLTPAMCALLLDRQKPGVAGFFRAFNSGFLRLTDVFVAAVGFVLKRPRSAVALFFALSLSALALFNYLPTGLVPGEDQGVAIVVGQLPPGAALSRSEQARDELTDKLLARQEVEDFISFAGFDLMSGALRTHAFAGFINLTDWADRTGAGQDAQSVAGQVMALGQTIEEANIFAFSPPPIMGLSLTGGVEGYLQMRGGGTGAELEQLASRFVTLARERPELGTVQSLYDRNTPKYHAEVDRERAKLLGVPINQIFDTMQSTFGSLYVNDFSLDGRNWQVNLQSEGAYRRSPDDLRRVFVRSGNGDMVPLSSLVTLSATIGSDLGNRFNLYPSAKLRADPAPGFTSDDAKAAMESVAAAMEDSNMVLGWVGEAFQLDAARGAAGLAFALGMVMVFLILAAQYESWTLPLAVVAAVPVAVLGAGVAALLQGFANDIYFQVGLLVLIGLAAKNAILIVEFASQNRSQGMTAIEAALSAARQRFRAITMTAMTFVIGTLPLAVASGAGANSRQEIGAVSVGGMLAASTLALIFVPLFFTLLDKLSPRPQSGDLPQSMATSERHAGLADEQPQ